MFRFQIPNSDSLNKKLLRYIFKIQFVIQTFGRLENLALTFGLISKKIRLRVQSPTHMKKTCFFSFAPKIIIMLKLLNLKSKESVGGLTNELSYEMLLSKL